MNANQTDLAMALILRNPLTYRGYVYDQETKLYYLQSRYYNPITGRFLNADALVSTGQGILGNNMFAYCQSNPTNCHDPSGCIIILSPDATDEQKKAFARAIAYLKTSKTGKMLIETLEHSKEKIIICFIDNDDMRYRFQTNTIFFDINSGLIVGSDGSTQSAALGLAHEMGHAAQELDGTYERFKYDRNGLELNNLETYEIPIATELGEPIRHTYDDYGTRNMKNVTHYITFVPYEQSFWYYLLRLNWFIPSGYEVHHNIGGSSGR